MRPIKEARKAKGLDVHFIFDQPMEMRDWDLWYVPPASVPKEGLIVDVGARDGDTLLFWAERGYKNFRLIEPNRRYFANLLLNLKAIQKVYPVKVEVRNKTFDLKDLDGAAFVKIDCEGCEYEFELSTIKVPWVAEMHKKQAPDDDGVYKSYVQATGYKTGP